MIDWEKYCGRIPSSVKINKNTYEVVWINGFPKDRHQLGESRFDESKQIVININQPIKEAVHTYWHELLHILSFEYDVNLTEKQVLNLEKSLPFLLKPNTMFADFKNTAKKLKSKKRTRR